MPLSDFQNAKMRQSVREWNDDRRDEFVIRWRHVLLAFGLGFMCAVFWVG